MAGPSKPRSRLRFFRAGGVDQMRLDTGADLLAVQDLDQKLWLALSCPTAGLEFDERTLQLLDTDADGRVRAPEILAALRFVEACLKDPEVLVRGTDSLPLAAIQDGTPEGKLVLASARHILAGLGKPDAKEISLADTMETARVFAGTKFNGDGIITGDSVGDPDAREVLDEIVACLGGVKDRAGVAGVDQAHVEQFFAELEAFTQWWEIADRDRDAILPLGDATSAAWDALAAVRAKVDDYFARCRLAAYDARALAAVNRREEEYLAVAANDFSISLAEVASFPLTRIEADRPLPLGNGINPAWQDALEAFRQHTVEPLLGTGRDTITEGEWAELKARLAAHGAWRSQQNGARVDRLGVARARAILAGGARENLTRLIAKDAAAAAEMNAIQDVERLVRYVRDLHTLLNNYVSFTDFYARRQFAVFQAGSLYLDGRRCDLCVRVADADKHALLAGLAKTYLAYCDCTRKATGEEMTIAAAFTAGDRDHLMVGRNGLFYDRKGRDWDATITRIVENPISVRQAFLSPYKRVLRWIDEQVAKRAAAADESASGKLMGAFTSAEDAAKTGKPPATKPKFDVGVVAALGVAVGGITAALGALLDAFFGLGFWMPLGILGLVVLISGPSMLIAWLKLRQRNLGPILDANGWAVNGRVRVNLPLGAALTQVATLPAGAERSYSDPYAERRRRWPWVLALLVLVGASIYAEYRWDCLTRTVHRVKAWIAERRGGDAPADPAAPAEGAPAPQDEGK